MKTHDHQIPNSAKAGENRPTTDPYRHAARSAYTASVGFSVAPHRVFSTLRKHMLVDGFDLVIDLRKSCGSRIVDARNGKRYLDFFTFFGSSPVGLNHPKMTSPDFLSKLAYVAVNKPSNSDIYSVEQAAFVEAFERVAIPSYLPHAFFIEGGALGVENALKAAFDWKVRKNFARGYQEERGRQVIHFKQAFHGRSGYTLSLTNTEPAKTALFPKFAWPRILNPIMRFPLTPENIALVERDEKTSIDQIKDAFTTHKDDIAAIIIEAIQGEGGDNHFRPEFFKMLRQLADENEAMLIIDEVQTGIGMTGKMWAHQHYSAPDMIAFGKKMQVCGFLCGNRIDEVSDNVFTVPSRVNSTWGGNLVDMVRSQRYLEIIEEENLVDNAKTAGAYLLSRLNEMAEEFPRVISNVRGLGLFCAFDVATPELRTNVRRRAYDSGLIVLPCGTHSIRFRPPLTVTTEEIDEGMEILQRTLKQEVAKARDPIVNLVDREVQHAFKAPDSEKDARHLRGMAPSSSLRLLCFPFAGGSRYSYRNLERHCCGQLVTDVLELPGRGDRIDEPFTLTMEEAVCDLMKSLRAKVRDRRHPYALFGHSLGGFLAFELTRAIQREDLPAPVHLFLSACPPPWAERRRDVHRLDDAQVVAYLKSLGGLPPEVEQNQELMRFFLPILRADLRVAELYTPATAPGARVPTTVIMGAEDSESIETMTGWNAGIGIDIRIRQAPGRHLFVHTHADTVAQILMQELSRYLTNPTIENRIVQQMS